mgnify:CR=1 FL=1
MYSREELAEQIIRYGQLCGEKNFTPGYSGNISARYQEGMLITTYGSSNGYLELNDIVYTDFSGNSLEDRQTSNHGTNGKREQIKVTEMVAERM